MKSFADYGHKTRLYSYDPDLNVPEGVELADASEIMPDVPDLTTYNGVAPFSDRFRLNMTAKTGEVWVDCDVAALRPMPDQPYIVAHMTRFVGNAVLRLPRSSKALQGLLEFVNAEEPWLPADWPWQRLFGERVDLSNRQGDRYILDVEDRSKFYYMTYGPHALTYFLRKTGQYALFDIRMVLFRRILKLPRTYFDRTPTGVTLARLTSDLEAISDSFVMGVLSMVRDLINTVALIILMLAIDWKLTLIVLTVFPLVEHVARGGDIPFFIKPNFTQNRFELHGVHLGQNFVQVG